MDCVIINLNAPMWLHITLCPDDNIFAEGLIVINKKIIIIYY